MLQAETATAQQVFDSRELTCSFLSEDCPDEIIIALPIVKGRVAEVNFPLIVKNKGKKTATEVAIYLRLPKSLTWENLAEMAETKAMLKAKKIEITFVPEGNFGTIVITIPRIPNYERLLIGIPLSIRSDTEIESEVTTNTKDNVPISLKYRVLFAYRAEIFATCEGATPQTRSHSIQIIDTSNRTATEILNSRSAEALLEANEQKRKIGFRGRLKNLFRDILRGEYKRTRFRRFAVFAPSNQDKITDSNFPIDRYGLSGGSIYSGTQDVRNNTLWIPSLNTSFFGRGTNPRS